MRYLNWEPVETAPQIERKCHKGWLDRHRPCLPCFTHSCKDGVRLSSKVGFVPRTLGHHIENAGSTPVRVINVFNSPVYEDVSLNQWMALTPPDLVKGHLNLDYTAMKALRREHRPVVR